MIYINEWLPNPAGDDAQNEWVEIFNSGPENVSLRGWILKTKSGKEFILNNYSLKTRAYLVLGRPQTKLVLKNTDEKLSLYDASGKLVDESGFSGSAPEGKSFQKISSASAESSRFVFGEPSPGQPNKISGTADYLINNIYPFNQPLNSPLSYFDVMMLAIGSGLVLAASTTFLFERSGFLTNLFFGEDAPR